MGRRTWCRPPSTTLESSTRSPCRSRTSATRGRRPHHDRCTFIRLAMSDALSGILETVEAERLATGFGFTEGPLWHPEGHYYFVDIRASVLYRLTPGQRAEIARSDTGEGNGTTFDLAGRLVLCEGGNRRVTRMGADGRIDVLMDRFEGKRL